MPDRRAALPAVHRILAHPDLRQAVALHGSQRCREAVRQALHGARLAIEAGAVTPKFEELVAHAMWYLKRATAPAYPEVINATGVLIHTNLGRAPRLAPPLPTYLALEYDLDAGARGERLAPVTERLTRYFAAEAAMVVTNNAAALVLLLAAHAAGREVIVSRGELIEIGGSFRLPEIMAAGGARLKEVGCTNRTHLTDYEAAIGAETAGILVAHRSNYHISGFTASPSLADVVELGHRRGVPVWVDQGSGCHMDLRRFGLKHEATVQELLAQGADAVLFSGDKLLAGPQAGVLVGRKGTIEPLRRHPLRRALRPDKGVLTALAATLDAYLAERWLEVPLYRLLATPVPQLARRARRLARRLAAAGVVCGATPCRAVLGGGTTPDQTLPSWGVELLGQAQRMAAALRQGTPPVVARVEDERVVVDLRAVVPDQDDALARAILAAAG